MKSRSAVSMEVEILLAKRKRLDEERAKTAASIKSSFEKQVKDFVSEVKGWFEYFVSFGITSVVEGYTEKYDLGYGLTEVELQKLTVTSAKDGEFLRLSPFFSELERGAPLRPRFNVVLPDNRKVTLVFWPSRLAAEFEKGPATWHIWSNEEDKSISPEYVEFTEDLVVGMFKGFLLGREGV